MHIRHESRESDPVGTKKKQTDLGNFHYLFDDSNIKLRKLNSLVIVISSSKASQTKQMCSALKYICKVNIYIMGES